MPWVVFEPTIPASERAKTVHALDRSATVTGDNYEYLLVIINNYHRPLVTVITPIFLFRLAIRTFFRNALVGSPALFLMY
jgi:hypothetical protein